MGCFLLGSVRVGLRLRSGRIFRGWLGCGIAVEER